MSCPNDSASSTKTDEFFLEEYKALRKEADDFISEARHIEIYAIGAIAAVWAWLAVHTQEFHYSLMYRLAWFIPVLFALLGAIRSLALYHHLLRIGAYMAQKLEPRLAPNTEAWTPFFHGPEIKQDNPQIISSNWSTTPLKTGFVSHTIVIVWSVLLILTLLIGVGGFMAQPTASGHEQKMELRVAPDGKVIAISAQEQKPEPRIVAEGMGEGIWALLGTVVGALITAVGWFVKSKMSDKAHQRDLRVQEIESQITGLYGPLCGMIQADHDRFSVVRELIPEMPEKRQGFELKEDKKAIWDFFIDTYFLPTQKDVRTLLYSKPHLRDYQAEQPALMSDIETYLQYASDLDSRHELFVKKQIGTDYPGKPYPVTLLDNLKKALKTLEQRREEALHS